MSECVYHQQKKADVSEKKIYIYIYHFVLMRALLCGLLFPLEVEVVVQARGLLCRLYLVYVRGGWVIYLRNLPRPPWCAGSKQYCARSHHQSPVPVDSADGGPSVFSLCLWRLGHLASEPSTPAPCPPWCAGLKTPLRESHQQFPAPVDSEDVSDKKAQATICLPPSSSHWTLKSWSRCVGSCVSTL